MLYPLSYRGMNAPGRSRTDDLLVVNEATLISLPGKMILSRGARSSAVGVGAHGSLMRDGLEAASHEDRGENRREGRRSLVDDHRSLCLRHPGVTVELSRLVPCL
jgi:hypothetical protein